MSIRWRPHTERPDVDLTAVVLATRDDENKPFLLGIYTFRAYTAPSGAEPGWWSECTDKHAPAEFWWVLEDELLEAMP